MGIESGIMMNDLARMARDGGNQPIGRPVTDMTFLEEAEFVLRHGHSRAEHEKMLAAHRRQDFEDAAVRDLRGDPPSDLVKTFGLGPKRARWVLYFEWRQQVAADLSRAQTRKAELDEIITAPAATKARQKASIQRTAEWLRGRSFESDEKLGAQLAEQLLIEEHRAEAAQQVMPEIERELDRAQVRLEFINGRESEFLHPALIEAAEKMGLGKLYVQKIAELRAVAELMFGLANVVGGEIGAAATVALPKIRLPNTPRQDDAYTINAAGRKTHGTHSCSPCALTQIIPLKRRLRCRNDLGLVTGSIGPRPGLLRQS